MAFFGKTLRNRRHYGFLWQKRSKTDATMALLGQNRTGTGATMAFFGKNARKAFFGKAVVDQALQWELSMSAR